MAVCVPFCFYVCAFEFVCIDIYVSVCAPLCMHYACVCAFAFAFINFHVSVCAPLCIHMCAFVFVCVCVFGYVLICAFAIIVMYSIVSCRQFHRLTDQPLFEIVKFCIHRGRNGPKCIKYN